MYNELAKKLKKILIYKKPLYLYKKDKEYSLLKKTVDNRKQIAAIIEINGLVHRDINFLMLKLQTCYLSGNEEQDLGSLIIPRKYVRMNFLKICEEINDQQEETELVHNLTQTQQQIVKNYQLKATPLPLIYELPLNRSIKLSAARHYIIQNLPTCIPPLLLNPPEYSTVIDSCASPGNKTSHLAALMKNTGKIYAFELNEDRFKLLKQNLDACNVKNTVCINQDFTSTNIDAEYILVDPSCSGSGIHPNYKKDEKRLESLTYFQYMILKKALSIKNAKKIIYSTCSLEEEENEQVIARILEEFEHEWEIEKINLNIGRRGSKNYAFYDRVLFFDRGETIGFFCALFSRKV